MRDLFSLLICLPFFESILENFDHFINFQNSSTVVVELVKKGEKLYIICYQIPSHLFYCLFKRNAIIFILCTKLCLIVGYKFHICKRRFIHPEKRNNVTCNIKCCTYGNVCEKLIFANIRVFIASRIQSSC